MPISRTSLDAGNRSLEVVGVGQRVRARSATGSRGPEPVSRSWPRLFGLRECRRTDSSRHSGRPNRAVFSGWWTWESAPGRLQYVGARRARVARPEHRRLDAVVARPTAVRRTPTRSRMRCGPGSSGRLRADAGTTAMPSRRRWSSSPIPDCIRTLGVLIAPRDSTTSVPASSDELLPWCDELHSGDLGAVRSSAASPSLR